MIKLINNMKRQQIFNYNDLTRNPVQITDFKILNTCVRALNVLSKIHQNTCEYVRFVLFHSTLKQKILIEAKDTDENNYVHIIPS